MKKFKIGDKVRLRNNLEVGKSYNKITFLIEMESLKGKEMRIEGISPQGNYILNDSLLLYYSEEMLEKATNNDNLFEFALGKLNMTKDELEEEYEKDKIEKQIVEDIKKRCKDFENYCSSRNCCACDVYKFLKRNNLRGLGDRNCILIYEHLFKKIEEI